MPSVGGAPMLTEVVVSDLGVIEKASVVLGPRLTALTGETGAGKTMIVEALSLLLGGRAESMMIRVGADEARIDGRFETPSGECVLTRVLSPSGRSRAYIDGNPVTVGQLAELGRSLVDVHAQHGHQSLLGAAAQRDALDEFGRVDRTELVSARKALHDIEDRLSAMGGDERARARELELLRFQHTELADAGLDNPNEDRELAAEEALLAGAVAHREAAALALEALRGDNGARDQVGVALSAAPTRSVRRRGISTRSGPCRS
jgi:DNA repair protein RecN (Recombination protein N)